MIIKHASAKLVASDSDTSEAFKSMHQIIMAKIKCYSCKDWIVSDIIRKHDITIFEWYCKENK